MQRRSNLQRKEKVRSGIQREAPRQYDLHRKFVRRHKCVSCAGSHQIECAHLRLETAGGTSLKPHDAWTLPLCAREHFAQHVVGEKTFWANVGKDPWKICVEFAKASPVEEVREYAYAVMIPLLERHAEHDARINALAAESAE